MKKAEMGERQNKDLVETEFDAPFDVFLEHIHGLFEVELPGPQKSQIVVIVEEGQGIVVLFGCELGNAGLEFDKSGLLGCGEVTQTAGVVFGFHRK